MQKTIGAALASGEPVRIYREGLQDGWADGYVAAAGPQFFALELIDEAIRFNGFNCFRYKDISECLLPTPQAAFIEKVLIARGLRRQTAIAIDLSSLSTLISTAGVMFPLVTLFMEDGDENVCYIGKVVGVTDHEVRLVEISTNGKWDPAPTPWPLEAITRVDFGGGYEEALFLVSRS